MSICFADAQACDGLVYRKKKATYAGSVKVSDCAACETAMFLIPYIDV